MATPASSAWHRRRSQRPFAPAESSFHPALLAPCADLRRPAPPPGGAAAAALSPPPAQRPAAAAAAPPPPPPRRALSRPPRGFAPPPPSHGRARAHVLLAKAAQAGALVLAALPLALPTALAAALSCDWPAAALARPAPGLVAYVATLVRVAAAAAALACVVVFHAVTLSNLRTTERARPPRPHLLLPVIYSSGPALRHLLALSVSGALQLPAVAVVCHGFRISRVVRARVAPSWLDLQLCLLAGAVAGAAFSVAWHVTGGYVLRVSPRRVPWRSRVRADLAVAARPAAAVLAAAAAAAAALAVLAPSADASAAQPAAALAAAAAEGAASLQFDLAGLRRWWICVEAAALCVACWTLSSVIVSVLLSQPYDFVLESQAYTPAPRDAGRPGVGGGRRPGRDAAAREADPAVLDALLFALNAGVNHPAADPTGILGALALQDLCDTVSATPAGRAPVFADADGHVWHEIVSACLFPIDKLAYRLWLRANSQRSELPAMFQASRMESAALYQSSAGFGAAPSGGGLSFGFGGAGAVLEDSCDEVLFGDAQRISHAAQALANLVVASRSPVANEDRYGVAQRTLVDVVTSLLQCHASCRAFNDSQLLQTRSVLSQGGGGGGGGGSGPNSTFAADERHRARLVEDALAHAVRQIVAAFRTHLRGYLDAQEPRWAGRFNATLAHFLKASDRGAPPAAPRSPF